MPLRSAPWPRFTNPEIALGADEVGDVLTEALTISREIGDAFAEAHALIAFSQHAMLLARHSRPPNHSWQMRNEFRERKATGSRSPTS